MKISRTPWLPVVFVCMANHCHLAKVWNVESRSEKITFNFILVFAIPGLTSRFFRGVPSIHEIECSGRELGPTVDVFGMTLYTTHDSRKLAYVNLKKNVCSTSGSYSACVIDRVNSHNSRIVTLLLDLQPLESRRVGCNITSFRAGEAHIVSWSIVIRQSRAYNVYYVHYVAQLWFIHLSISYRDDRHSRSFI